MDGRKTIALFVTFIMLATSLVIVADTSVADASNTIVSDDTANIDVGGTFNENKSELAKLGITSQSGWTYNEKYDCYKLVLDNVDFKTYANVGISFTADARDTDPTVIIELKGENRIVSGSTYTTVEESENQSIAILAKHMDSRGVRVDDFNIVFVGDGSLRLSNAVSTSDTKITVGLGVYGNVAVLQTAKIFATAADFLCHTNLLDENDPLWFLSAGVYVWGTLTVWSNTDGASVVGEGGDIHVYYDRTSTIDKSQINSFGVRAMGFNLSNAYLSGEAGEAVWNTTVEGFTTQVESFSNGVSLITNSTDNSTSISNSKVVGISDYAIGSYYAESTGVILGSSDGTTVIDNSIVIGNGNTAECIESENSYVYSIGIMLYGDTDVTDSYLSGTAGELAAGAANSFNFGIWNTGDMNIEGSIVFAVGKYTAKSGVSNGLIVGRINVESSLTITDSEIYAKANDYALWWTKDIFVSSGYRQCAYLDNNGKWIDVKKPSEIPEGAKGVKIAYAYDVVVYNDEMGIMDFDRSESRTYKVGPYEGFVPKGMEFAGYYDTDGQEVKVGSTLTLSHTELLTVEFDKAKGSNNDNTWIIAVVIAVVVIVALLLVAGIYLYGKR